MIGIVVSRADEASTAIGEALLRTATWEVYDDPDRPAGDGAIHRRPGFELRAFDELHLDLDGVGAAFDDPDLLVFVSRHAGDTGALLTAHPTGNFGPADHGGRAGELAPAAPAAQRRVLAALHANAPTGYDVGMECTHHGPTDLDVPAVFVEVGSGEAQWRDPVAVRAVAHAVLDIEGVAPTAPRTVVGFGGGHYVPRFERIVRETDWAVGHVAADWAIEAAGGLRADLVREAFERSGAERALVDGDCPGLESTIESSGYEVVTETWVRETDGVPLALVDRVGAVLGRVDDGVRFGDRAVADVELEVYEPDPALLEAAVGVDRAGAWRAVEGHAVAFETAEGASRPAGRVAVPHARAVDGLLDGLADVLESRYDEVERGRDGIVVERTAFDPEAAAELGVPEGPAFGRLAEGHPVEVGGRTVTPEQVSTRERLRFSR